MDTATEDFRLIVFRKDASQVLLASRDRGFELPRVTVTRWRRIAESVTAAMKKKWGEEVICLFQLSPDALASARNKNSYLVAQSWRRDGVAELPTRWVASEDVQHVSFADPGDCAAIRRSLKESCNSAHATVAGPFAKLGWFDLLRQWIEDAIATNGIHLNGNFHQLNASPHFSLIRFETDGPAVWFKAVGQPNTREFHITLMLACLFPNYVPHLLASRRDWNGWLSSEVEGVELAETDQIEIWKTAAEQLAALQVSSISETSRLIASGAHDLRTAKLSSRVAPFMEVVREVMDRQVRMPPPVLGRNELACLAGSIEDALEVIEKQGFPEALGHLDPNPGNIIVSKSECRFLDWAEAYVGHPAFTLEYLIEHLRRMHGDAVTTQQLTDAYKARWQAIVSTDTIAEALAVTPLLAVFAYAAGSCLSSASALRDRSGDGYLRSLARRMNREAGKMIDRRQRCRS